MMAEYQQGGKAFEFAVADTPPPTLVIVTRPCWRKPPVVVNLALRGIDDIRGVAVYEVIDA